MSLETATFIDELDATNPTTTDNKSQGDDHFRLVKQVLKNSVKRVTRAFYVPGTVTKSGNYSVLAADDNKTIVCDTTSAFTLTLPTLAASDAGWCVYVQKSTTDANPVFIAPPSGTINGYTKIRRSIEHVITKVLWNGSLFVASRPNGVPIGSVLEYHGSTLPNGHLWPGGATFVAADYVELNTVLGGNTKPDHRGRVVAGKDDMETASANRLTGLSGGVNGDTLGAAGGLETHTLTEAQLAVHDHLITDVEHGHLGAVSGQLSEGGVVNTLMAGGGMTNDLEALSMVDKAFSGITTTQNSGSGSAHNNVQPTIIANKILVAE